MAAAAGIGFPVMVKATGGGGGIGMLACADEAAAAAAFTRVQRLAAANFGAGGVFLERLVRPARHVEVQIFGDGTGAVVVLGDRDCSLQRRNQKVIEEAPAPGLPPTCGPAARGGAGAGRIGAYRSAGTVEFVYDPAQQEASFLEVNARLQVEHPVTEEVYGVDLVEQMLRLAGQGPDGVASLLACGPGRLRSRGRGPRLRRGPESRRPPQPRPGHLRHLAGPGRHPGRRLDRGGTGGAGRLRPDGRQGHRPRR